MKIDDIVSLHEPYGPGSFWLEDREDGSGQYKQIAEIPNDFKCRVKGIFCEKRTYLILECIVGKYDGMTFKSIQGDDGTPWFTEEPDVSNIPY